MIELLALATSLFTVAPAMAQEQPAATVTPTTTTAAPTTASAPAAASTTAPSMWQSLGNQVLARDTIVSMDRDNSNTISREEYLGYYEAQFKALDANGDGSLSADELGTGKKKNWMSFW